MIDASDFSKKQIIFLFPAAGDKLSFSNDNIVVKNSEGKIKYQSTCYRLFLLCVIGDTTVTTGVLRRAHKFGFAVCFMTQSFRIYEIIGTRMEGNTLLRLHQYQYDELAIGKRIIENKIANQRNALLKIRKRTPGMTEAIRKLEEHGKRAGQVENARENLTELLGIEGSASRTYFPQFFNNVNWKGRKPRIKSDYVNTTLDIGYTLLFHLVDSILQVYGFDTYYGVLHRCFYMRKSLVCDIVEPMRPIVDYEVRKAINLGQCKEEDFECVNGRYLLKWENSAQYVSFLMEAILQEKEQIFLYIQGYYRAFMKQKPAEEFPEFEWR